MTEQDLREALSGDNLYRRVTVMSYILNDAEPDDVWKYLVAQDIQGHFWQIRWRSASWREYWQNELTLKGYPPDECADPIAARVLI